MSKVVTLSYIPKHTSVPVSRAIASGPTAENELGCEWILMEKVPGVALVGAWSDMNLETKVIAGFLRRLRRIQPNAIGNLYFREDVER